MLDFSKIKLNYSNIRFENHKISTAISRSDIDVSCGFGNFTFSNPVVPANMSSIETYELLKLYDSEGMFYVKHRIDGVDEVYQFCKYAKENNFRVLSLSIGVKPEWIKFLHRLRQENIRPDYITLDIANSYSINILEISRTVYQLFPDSFYTVGNGMSSSWVEWLENIPGIRVDAAKVGIGTSGSCRTYNETGYQSTTVSHLEECASAAKRLKIISDGGLEINNNQVDLNGLAKSIRFGADMIMSGSIFSRCSDNPAAKTGKYFGNSTSEAKNYTEHIEGCTVEIKNTSRTTLETIKHVEESLQSSISYCGGNKLSDLRNADYYITL